MATLAVSPLTIRPSQTSTVTFIGTGTTWQSVAPTFTPTGVAGVSIGSVTVVSDTNATAPVTTGSTKGVLTWTDSTTIATVTQIVGDKFLKWCPQMSYAYRLRRLGR